MALIFYIIKRELIELLSHKRNYQLSFFVYNNGRLISGYKFTVVDYFGKRILNDQGELCESTSDSRGYVSFGEISGGKYKIIPMNSNMNIKPFKATVKHLKDKKFYIRKVVKNGYQIDTEGDETND
ncbi:hypothetical protein GCM10025879_16540 [Leuconostoc litchii]|nr:hypothetical protein GCM10025879_16540 [Leuconostoc litchii]